MFTSKYSERAGASTLHIFRMVSCLIVAGTSSLAIAAEISAPTPAGMWPHFESLIAACIVTAAVLTAIFLNHASPKIRAFGTLLASLECFCIVIWFGFVLSTGVLEDPKPQQAPMDAIKPALLWLQTVAALAGGLLLMVVANGQWRNTDTLELAGRNEVERYGKISRLLHWTTAILFLTMIPMGTFASMIPEDVWYRTEYNIVHKTIGFTVLILFFVRIFWNRKSKRPALDNSLISRDVKLAHIAHASLYFIMLTLPITGYVMTSMHGYSSFFFIFELKPFLAESDAYVVWGLFHKYLLPYGVYLFLGAHIIGVLKHHYIDKKHQAIKRMVT
jgi:cytochrome b561